MADDHQLAEATQALSFAEFLERMKDPQAANLVKLIKTYASLQICHRDAATSCNAVTKEEIDFSLVFKVHQDL